MIWKLWKKGKLKCEMIWKKGRSNSEKIWKIQKKIVKRYEKYGTYGRKVNFFTKQLILHVIYLSLHYALRQCYPHMNSYVPYCSVKPPHKELFPLL
jgi:hypothetical protein